MMGIASMVGRILSEVRMVVNQSTPFSFNALIHGQAVAVHGIGGRYRVPDSAKETVPESGQLNSHF
jgi:hypothetical protein